MRKQKPSNPTAKLITERAEEKALEVLPNDYADTDSTTYTFKGPGEPVRAAAVKEGTALVDGDGTTMPETREEEGRGVRFEVDTVEKAEWAIDKVLGAEERLKRVKEACQSMVSEAEHELSQARERFLPHLEAFYEANPPKKGRHIKTRAGRIGFRARKGGVKVRSRTECLAWAVENAGGLIEERPAVNMDALRAYVDETGEIPPGVEVDPGGDTFYVKVGQ